SPEEGRRARGGLEVDAQSPYYVRLQTTAGWSSQAARRAHNPKVAGSNPAPATNPISRTAPTSGAVSICSSPCRQHGRRRIGDRGGTMRDVAAPESSNRRRQLATRFEMIAR